MNMDHTCDTIEPGVYVTTRGTVDAADPGELPAALPKSSSIFTAEAFCVTGERVRPVNEMTGRQEKAHAVVRRPVFPPDARVCSRTFPDGFRKLAVAELADLLQWEAKMHGKMAEIIRKLL